MNLYQSDTHFYWKLKICVFTHIKALEFILTWSERRAYNNNYRIEVIAEHSKNQMFLIVLFLTLETRLDFFFTSFQQFVIYVKCRNDLVI